jgi:FMN reductase
MAGVTAAGARTTSLDLPTEDLDTVVDRIDEAGGVVFASPVYRAAHTALLASLLERIPRGAVGETRAPLAGKAALVLLTGASHHHFLATERLARTVGIVLRGPGPFTWPLFHPNLVHSRPGPEQ